MSDASFPPVTSDEKDKSPRQQVYSSKEVSHPTKNKAEKSDKPGKVNKNTSFCRQEQSSNNVSYPIETPPQDRKTDKEEKPDKNSHFCSQAQSSDASQTCLSTRMALQLAAPHTWPASILPVLIAVCSAGATFYSVSISITLILLIICILMQAAANTLNDYYDYVKGADSIEDKVDPSDAVLVYNHINPRTARNLALSFLLVGFVLGIYIIVKVGWIPLVIALVGALVVVLYSAGKTPLSYLPVGEIVSGVVMGGLIPLACFNALTGVFNLLVLVWAIPTILGVGLIMLTNNTCDREKDLLAQRHTLPALLGYRRTRFLYRTVVVVWLISIVVLIACFFAHGLILVPFMLLSSYPLIAALMKNPLIPTSRIPAMSQVCELNIVLGAFYVAGILAQQGITFGI